MLIINIKVQVLSEKKGIHTVVDEIILVHPKCKIIFWCFQLFHLSILRYRNIFFSITSRIVIALNLLCFFIFIIATLLLVLLFLIAISIVITLSTNAIAKIINLSPSFRYHEKEREQREIDTERKPKTIPIF